MLFQLPTSALLLALAVLAEASPHGNVGHLHRRHAHARGPKNVEHVPRASLGRRSCKSKSSSALSASSTSAAIAKVASTSSTTTKAAATTTSVPLSSKFTNVSSKSSTTSSSSVKIAAGDLATAKEDSTTTTSTTTASTKSPTTTTTSTKATTTTSDSSDGVAAGDFTATKPADWPTATQAGATPTSTVASTSDPYLEELSKALDNSGNSFFTETHTGDMTYYGQGLGACGDVYDDNSFTAAVSELMFDNWPGASTAAQNRNPICGPFVPARMALNSAGTLVSAVTSSIAGYASLGGDGLLNCVGTTSPAVQCHVPLTATVMHGDVSIQVQIVDRCTGCAVDDIDLTPAAFAALADTALGRTSVTWKFDNW
ncbi:hypothetical protein DFH06DRAFT_1204314 [Mycena polygramma]|nr:hypothetical protein DFH06DRAFT_1204314 [Mycena polygramma]